MLHKLNNKGKFKSVAGEMCGSWNWFFSRLPENDFGMVTNLCKSIYFILFLSDGIITLVQEIYFLSLELQAEQGFYFIGKDLSALLKQKFQQLSGTSSAGPAEVEVVMGRTLKVCFNLCSAEA